MDPVFPLLHRSRVCLRVCRDSGTSLPPLQPKRKGSCYRHGGPGGEERRFICVLGAPHFPALHNLYCTARGGLHIVHTLQRGFGFHIVHTRRALRHVARATSRPAQPSTSTLHSTPPPPLSTPRPAATPIPLNSKDCTGRRTSSRQTAYCQLGSRRP